MPAVIGNGPATRVYVLTRADGEELARIPVTSEAAARIEARGGVLAMLAAPLDHHAPGVTSSPAFAGLTVTLAAGK